MTEGEWWKSSESGGGSGDRMMEVKDVKRLEKYTTTVLKKMLPGEVERRCVEKTELERKMSERGRAGAPTEGLSFP